MHIKKSLGQHFLKDETIIKTIIQALQKHYPIQRLLEIGPGMGVLTKILLEEPIAYISAVEIDRDKIQYLQPFFKTENQQLIHADCLAIDSPFPAQNFWVIGNFPYNISTQIMFKLLSWKTQVEGMIGMFQKEVAMRIISAHGTKNYGILSVLTQVYFHTELVCNVAPISFTPAPKVDSAVILLTKRAIPLPCYNYDSLLKIVKAAFNQRRKMLRNSLLCMVEKDILYSHPLAEKRPEQLSVLDFCELSFLLKK